MEPGPSLRPWPLARKPPPLPLQGLYFQEEVILQASQPNMVGSHDPILLSLIHWLLVPCDVSAFLSRAPNQIITCPAEWKVRKSGAF